MDSEGTLRIYDEPHTQPQAEIQPLCDGMAVLPMAKKLVVPHIGKRRGLRVPAGRSLRTTGASILNFKTEDWNPDENIFPAALAFECPFTALQYL